LGSNIPPQPRVDQIVWFETHLPQWAAAPTTFGTTAAAVTALTNLVEDARKAYEDAAAAREASKAATVGETMAVNSMLTSGRAMVNTMKAFIENAHNPSLWSAAGLTPPDAPGTSPDPTAPYAMSAGLDSMGNVIVKWKASQPRGTSGVIYSVRRAIDGGEYVLLDSVGGKTFTDETVAVGTESVSYAIRAKRGSQMSAWSEALTIRFGRVGGGGGGMFIASTETGVAPPMKMAA
jgi:predicted DNA-binding WGR domain protein